MACIELYTTSTVEGLVGLNESMARPRGRRIGQVQTVWPCSQSSAEGVLHTSNRTYTKTNSLAMKRWSASFLLLTVLLLFTSSTSAMRKLLGGWSSTSVDDPSITEAAEFCFQSLIETAQERDYSFAPQTDPSLHRLKVIQASQQVVAGLNIRLTMMVVEKSGDDKCLGAFSAKIYDHFGDYSVTEWGEEITCAQAKTILEEASEK